MNNPKESPARFIRGPMNQTKQNKKTPAARLVMAFVKNFVKFHFMHKFMHKKGHFGGHNSQKYHKSCGQREIPRAAIDSSVFGSFFQNH